MNDKLSRQNRVLYACGIIPVVWLALLAAPLLEGGLGTLLEGFGTALENPFHIIWCDKSLKTLLIFLMLYCLVIGIYVSNERVYRRREEQGSARWGDPGAVSKKYRQGGNGNKLLTQQVALGLDGRKHRRNLNVLICGGSGAGKTRFYAKPNIMQANTSFVILDPKGELLRDTGHLLEEKGYVIKVLDLINPERSHCYNPFVYLRDDDDIQRLATNIMKNTTPKDSKSSDHFWEDMAAMLLKALISYLHYEAPPEEQNFPMVMDMIRAGDVKEDNEEYVSTLDELFERLERRNPEHIAVRYYKGYHSGSGKTLKSIQITLISHLEKFNLTSLAGITQTDEMELGEIGERKTAVFAVIPDSDSSYNFIVGMLYTQLFQQIHSGKTEPGKDAVNLGGVLCSNHNVRNAVSGVLVLEDAIKNTVLFGLLAKFLKIPVLNGEHFQFLAGAEHIGQTDFTFGFLLVFQNGVNHDRQLLGGGAGQFCRDLNPVQAQTDDLICRLAGIAHAVLPPFFRFPVPAVIAPDSAPSERNGLRFRHIISPPDAVFLSQRIPL